MTKLTQAKVKKDLQDLGLSFRKTDHGEFRVAMPPTHERFKDLSHKDRMERSEISAAYLDNLEDALATGIKTAEWWKVQKG